MRQVFKTDSEGFYVEPVILKANESVPSDCVAIKPPDGLYKAKLVQGVWVEGLSQTEVNTIKNTPAPVSEIEQVKRDQADLIFTLMMNGVL